MKPSFRFSVLTMLSAFSVSVVANDFEVENLENPSFTESSFPYVTSKKHPQSAKNINTYLQYNLFGKQFDKQDFKDKTKSPFSSSSNNSRNIYVYEYQVLEKTNYIQITLASEACGAYCEGAEENYLFNVYTGKVVTLSELLSPARRSILEAKIVNNNRKKIEPYIAKKPLDSWPEESHAEYNMFKNCYERMDGHVTLNNETSFSISDNSINIEHGRCSNHAMRGLDEIGSFINKLSFTELTPYLNQNGKKFLSSTPYSIPFNLNSLGVWRGIINNKYPITMVNPKHGNRIYWYDKYKKPIELKEDKDQKNNKLTLTEGYYYNEGNRSKFRSTAQIDLTIKDDKFIGTFKKLPDNGKVLSVNLK